MKQVVVDFRRLPDQGAVHAYLAQQLGFPDWYGKNFDALHDCLTDIREDVQLVLRNHEALGRLGEIFKHVIADACEDNKHVQMICEEDERNGN